MFVFVAALVAVLLSYRQPLPRGGIVILFTSEIRGHVVACGCYEGQPGGLGRLPAASPEDFGTEDTLLLDGGDFVGNPPMEGFDDPEKPGVIHPVKMDYLRRKHGALVEIMKWMDYSAVSPGEYDFILGQPFLLEAYQTLGNRFVSANLLYTDTMGPVFKSFRIVTVGRGSVAGIPFGGLKVGILGLLPQETVIRPVKGDIYGLTIADPEATAKAMVPRMREKGAEVIILLYHAPLPTVRSLVTRVQGIDVAFAGHEGRGHALARVGDTQVVDILPGCTHVGRMMVEIESGAVKNVTFKSIKLAEELPENPELLAPYEAFQRELAASLIRPPLLTPPPQGYSGSDRCRDCHGPANDGLENPYDHWNSTPHARAMEALLKKRHEGDPECLQCHTTGFSRQTGYGSPAAVGSGLDAVGCEVCHGPRMDHALKWEKKRAAGEPFPKNRKGALPAPFAKPCQKCHTQARDEGFDRNKEKRYEGVRHRLRE
jgi:2',3'-cyclic-nucleotide 2'-phosphodiesterase (5'-nucleotidase family)